jgi:hypothetical protein
MYQCCNINKRWNATKSDCEDEWNYDEDVIDGEIERLQRERDAAHRVMCERARKFDALLEKTVALKKENDSLKCCGTCKKWEIDTETSPYFMDTGREDCEHYDPTFKCENWEARR